MKFKKFAKKRKNFYKKVKSNKDFCHFFVGFCKFALAQKSTPPQCKIRFVKSLIMKTETLKQKCERIKFLFTYKSKLI